MEANYETADMLLASAADDLKELLDSSEEIQAFDMNVASLAADKHPDDAVSAMMLLIIFVVVGLCLTCLCISLGYLIM